MEKGAKDIMAGWNGSDRKGAAPVQPKVTAKKPSPVRGIVAGAVVVVLAVVAYFAFFSGSEKPQKVVEQKKPSAIKEVAPSISTNKVAAVEEKPNPNLETYRDARGILRYKVGNGRVPDPNLKTHKNTPTRDKDGNKRFGSKYTIFENRSENEIARLISMPPGTQMFGTRRYDDKFEADFLKSCETPIIVEKGDSEYVKNLKKAMNETKIEIRNRMAAGEKLADILTETRKELQRLATYRRDLKRETADMLQSGTLTDQDADDVITAANKMLEQKGLNPIPKSSLIRNHVKINESNFDNKQKGE